MTAETKMSAPWEIRVDELMVFFEGDKDIKISYDEQEKVVTLRVDGNDKAEAIMRLLPEEYDYGNVKLKLKVIPANRELQFCDLVKRALTGNPHFSRMLNIDPGSSNTFHYAMFRREVVQYYTDNLGDPYGNTTTLYQDLAQKILGAGEGVYYCTERL